MISLVSFRPGVISNGTALEAMTLIYKYLQEHYGYIFTIVKSEDDGYQNQAFKVISIPTKKWKVSPYSLLLPIPWVNDRYLEPIFAQADGILTVDPTIYLQGLLAIRKAHRAGKPVWFDASRTDLSVDRSLGWKLKHRTIQKALAQTAGIVVTVPKCIERFRNLGLFNAAIAPKFTIMGHPVDTTRFAPQPSLSEQDGVLRVIVASRMIPEKGLLYILEAMTQLLRERSNIQLQLLGSGPMQPLLKREVEERGLNEKVIFLNPVPHEELPSILSRADLFVNHAVSLSQWEEFFGVINVEAMACGLPCVLSTSGGIPYAIREKDVAIIVEERNIIQLREAITRLLDSEQERREIGERARDYVERYYALPILAEKYHRMLQRGFWAQNNSYSVHSSQ